MSAFLSHGFLGSADAPNAIFSAATRPPGLRVRSFALGRPPGGWIDFPIASPDHCANLMDPLFDDMGAAFSVNAASEMGVYWVQVFGTTR